LPRAALVGTELRGVVGSSLVAARQRTKKGPTDRGGQLTMFDS
jgi:hypothetical protein